MSEQQKGQGCVYGVARIVTPYRSYYRTCALCSNPLWYGFKPDGLAIVQCQTNACILKNDSVTGVTLADAFDWFSVLERKNHPTAATEGGAR